MTTEPQSDQKSFNPRDHLILLKGKEYLPVQWRLVWLRDQYPDARVYTEVLHLDLEHGFCMCRATVTIPDKGSATGIGSETSKDFGDYIEKAECVPLRSRILTKHGFKRFNELAIGEGVLAYDHKVDATVWTPLREVKVYPEGDVIALTNRWGYRLECTQDHSWPVRYSTKYKGKQYNYFKMREAQHLKACDRMVLAATAPGGDSPITPEEAAIIGWLFTDGTIRRKNNIMSEAVITQSKPEQIEVIRELVGSVATLPVRKAYTAVIAGNTKPSQCLPQHSFRLPLTYTRALFAKAGIETDADLPAFVCRLSADARKAMFDAMMRADGSTKGDFSKKRRPGTMEAWRVLCALQGIATGALQGIATGALHMRPEDMPSQRARKTRHMCASQLKVEQVGKRPVWCPTTDYGTWVMEQDGVVTITGNTKGIGRALAALGLGTQFMGDELEEGQRIVDSPVERKAPAAPAKTLVTPMQLNTIRTTYHNLCNLGAAKPLNTQQDEALNRITFSEAVEKIDNLNKMLDQVRAAQLKQGVSR